MGMIKTPLVRQVARGLARILGDMAQFCDAASGGGDPMDGCAACAERIKSGLSIVGCRNPRHDSDRQATGDQKAEWLTLAALLRACVRMVEAKL